MPTYGHGMSRRACAVLDNPAPASGHDDGAHAPGRDRGASLGGLTRSVVRLGVLRLPDVADQALD